MDTMGVKDGRCQDCWLDSFPTMAAIFGYELLDDLGVPHFRMEHDSEDRLLPVPECLNGSF